MNLRRSRHLFIVPAAVALAAAVITGCGPAHAKAGSPPSPTGGQPAPASIVQVSDDPFGAVEPAVAVNPQPPQPAGRLQGRPGQSPRPGHLRIL